MTEEHFTKECFKHYLLDRVGTHWHVLSIHDIVMTNYLHQAAPKTGISGWPSNHIAVDFAEPVTNINIHLV